MSQELYDQDDDGTDDHGDGSDDSDEIAAFCCCLAGFGSQDLATKASNRQAEVAAS